MGVCLRGCSVFGADPEGWPERFSIVASRSYVNSIASPQRPHDMESQQSFQDSRTTLSQLRELVREFVRQRAWEPFHTPKNLVMALAVEAAELMEHFQWLTPEQGEQVRDNPATREAVAEEMADVLCYLLALSDRLGIDLSSAVVRKMHKNARKYPAETFRGYFGPDDPRWPGPRRDASTD